jgi:uncharacterized protein with ParB-like and HNH nuclease domain
MNPTEATVGNVFGNRTIQYRIPQYQRRYEWSTENVHVLWRDIGTLHQERTDSQREQKRLDNTKHFLGILLVFQRTIRNPFPVTVYEVVDGQQRLTTLLLLMAALRDHRAEAEGRKIKFDTDQVYCLEDLADNKITNEKILLLQDEDQDELDTAMHGGWRKRYPDRKRWGNILRTYEYFRYCLWNGVVSFDEVQTYEVPTPKTKELTAPCK